MTHTTPETFADLNAALDHAKQAGTPHVVDWPHREVYFRILARMFRTLDRPLADLETLLPEEFGAIPEPVRAAIPGNPSMTTKVIRGNLLRARSVFRPDLYPWDAVLALAEPEIIAFRSIWTPVCRAATKTGVTHPSGLTAAWIAEQLEDVTASDETYRRGIFAAVVRASRISSIQEAGLLRSDLALPPTLQAVQRAVSLPPWLQALHDTSNRPTRNAILRIWRTVLHHGWSVEDADDLVTLMDAGFLSHEAANAVEKIQPKTWQGYVQGVRRALVSRC